MKTVSCIICPNSCTIEIDENTLVASGNKCPRGLEYAKQEITNPQRSVTSTVKTSFKHFPVLPCRTNKSVSKSKMMEVMNEINKVTVNNYLKVGEIIIKNIAGTDADLIATANVPEIKEY
ncbi:MAG: DUF1667 domain-containing protein [Bacilli bacterium]|nr:DUF1667 domain-containing protein [Bacilli bacterium]